MGEDESLVSPDDLAGDAGTDLSERVAAMLQQRAEGPWRPGCASCINNHKLAIFEVAEKLKKAGLVMGSPEFGQRMQQAVALGQMLMQNPLALQGMNGTKPDVIPAVRPADTFIGGNAVCGICFVVSKRSSLALAPANWHPGMGFGA
jgi:hypothetical protein